jgi:glycosyltransferase involved in cell wall biosynthesis
MKKIKVLVLHPPMYPINHKFFNLLAKEVDLMVVNIGEYPMLHMKWKSEHFLQEADYLLKIYGRGALSIKNQLNMKWIKNLIYFKPDIVLSIAFWIPSLYAAILKRLFNYKLIIVTDANDETDKNLSSLKKFIRKIICKNTDAVISASPMSTNYLKKICKTNIYESYQTIDMEEWIREIELLPNKNLLREKLNLPKEKIILLGVGSFIEKKNWEMVFETIADIDNVFVVLIGSGELKQKYLELVNKKNLREKVLILDRKEGKELKEYFKASDVFVLPSLYDQFGYVVMEAMASKLAVIVSKNAGVSSIIEDKKHGMIINPYKTFENELLYTIDNLYLFQKDAFELAKKFTLQNKIKEYKNIFLNVLGE